MTMNRLSGWIDHGLKVARWPASRAARVALLLALGLSILGTYLVQSSQIVAANRHVETLQRDLLALRRQNALRLESIAEATTAAKLIERAKALGFQPAEMIEFVWVPTNLHDDTPALRDGYRNP
ncbi:MAG: hypothetical protein ACRDGG_04860 [Anaerolineae bacterium]